MEEENRELRRRLDRAVNEKDEALSRLAKKEAAVAAVKQEQRQKAGCRLAGCTMLQRTLVP